MREHATMTYRDPASRHAVTRRGRWTVLVVSATILFGAGGCSPPSKSQYLIPEKGSARAQYYFAAQLETEQRNRPTRDHEAQFRPVIEAFEKVRELHPDDQEHSPLALLDLGRLHFELKDIKEALACFKQAGKQYGAHDFVQARSLLWRGRCYEALGANAKARELYGQCVEMYADHPDKLIKETTQTAMRLNDRVLKR